MSIQSEINRISGNVNDTLGVLSDAGVVVPANANSDNLPDLVSEAVNAIIPIERGGTNGTTKLEAANNLGVPAMWERTKIPNGTDLNTITTPGNYCSQSYLSSTNLVNCPTEKPFIMNVYYACGDKWYIAQEIIEFMDGIRYFRMITSSGTCYTWVKNYSNASKMAIGDCSGHAIVSQGGTGRTSLTKDCYLVGNNEYGVQLKTRAEVLADIGAVSVEDYNALVARVAALEAQL